MKSSKLKIDIKKFKKHKFLIILGIVLILLLVVFKDQKSTNYVPNSQSSSQDLSEDEKFLLNPPSADASKSEIEKHAQIVERLATESSTLEIRNCKPNPLVVKIKEGADIEIRNMDDKNRRIVFDALHYYDIPANNSIVLSAKFRYGSGDYGYVCDGMGISGFLHIIP